MAEAIYSSKLLLLYFIFLPVLIYYLCSFTHDFLTAVERNSHCVSSRRLFYHKGFRPKYQYHCHWFKVRMKQKKRRKFRKPKPLFHLTAKGKLLIGIHLFAIRFHRVLNYVYKQIQLLQSCLHSLFYHARSKSLNPVVVACPATATGLVPRRLHSQFDTDSFKIGIDTMCSCTMSGNKHHFQDLREGPTPKTVGGIGDSALKIAGIGTFTFKIVDDTGEVCTV